MGGGGGIHYKNDKGACSTCEGLKKTVLVSLRVFSVKRFTAGAFALPLRVLNY